MTDDFKRLATILADWAADAPAATLYVFGSRVRGDHRPDSDLDVIIQWDYQAMAPADHDWWQKNCAEDFATIDAALGARLHFPDPDPVSRQAFTAAEVYRDRNVICVLVPKPTRGY
jgi:hypothetical protein